VSSAVRAILDELRDVVGAEHVLTDPEITRGYRVDWTGRFAGETPAVIRPARVDEVRAVLALCDRARVAVVPQGGNTGLVGGSVPLAGEVVLSLLRMDRLEPVDETAAQVTAGAGARLAELQAHARAAGWEYGVDLGARASATVGGTVATNAGGMYVLRYGATRRQVVGLQAVLASGDLVERLDGLEKDNTGYDLGGLLCGSEGTLAVVTAARLRLVPPATHVVVALLAFDGIDDALVAVAELRRTLDAVRALEMWEQVGLDLVCEQLGLAPPFPQRHGVYVLVEAAARTDPTNDVAAVVDGLTGVRAAAVATDTRAAHALWRYREGHPEAVNRLGPPHKLDVTLGPAQLPQFFERVRSTVARVAPGARVWLFGHAGDGNVHVNVTGVAPDEDEVSDAVFQLVAELHGSISAEHGIGTAKRRWLHFARAPAELRAMRAIKDALDPNRILNPHVLLPED
jgi:FAD/FMN-containing dehydrogenase